MGSTSIGVVAVLFIFFLIWGLLRIGMRIGVKRAIENIVQGFLSEEKTLAEAPQEANKLQLILKNHDYWYSLFGSFKEFDKEYYTKRLGVALHEISNLSGQDIGIRAQRLWAGKADHEANIRMDRKALNDVARLANGFLAWINQSEEATDRLTKDEALKMARELEEFEGHITRGDEMEEEKRLRYERSFNRERRLWDLYK